jgi:hypothetical protein
MSLLDGYQERGWTFIPIQKLGKRPVAPWKEHITKGMTSEQVTDYKNRIEQEDLNVGIVTGKKSDLLVVDFDYKHGGKESLDKLIDRRIIKPFAQFNVDTPHGKHVYFKYPNVDMGNSAGIMPGVDVRGEGGYVVAPPSKLEDGEYTHYAEGKIVEPPDVLIDILTTKPASAGMGAKEYSVLMEGVGEGKRNTVATTLAGVFFNKGLSADMVLSTLSMWNEKNKPPMAQEEIEGIVINIKERELTKRVDDKKPVVTQDFPIPDIPIVSEYVRLAGAAIPSPDSYHVLCCLSLMATLLAEHVALPLKSDMLHPNLYVMLLADTTWTYKTTSMKRGLKFLDKVYPDALLGSGGSPEGLFYAISERPALSSLFFRDEAVGFFYEAGQKNYMTGFLDSLTKYYDCQSERRVLAGREGQTTRTVHIRDPRLSLMAGGTLTRFFDVIDEGKIMDGFLPRFLFSVRAGSASNMKPLEVATIDYNRDNDLLLQDIMRVFLRGQREVTTHQSVLDYHHEYMLSLVTSEYARYGGLDFGGVYNRLAISVLKVAMLLAVMDSTKNKVRMNKKHLENAILLAQEWKRSVDYIVRTVSKPRKERQYDKLVAFLHECGGKTSQANIMTTFHIESRDFERMVSTLIDREIVERNGRLVILRNGN